MLRSKIQIKHLPDFSHHLLSELLCSDGGELKWVWQRRKTTMLREKQMGQMIVSGYLMTVNKNSL